MRVATQSQVATWFYFILLHTADSTSIVHLCTWAIIMRRGIHSIVHHHTVDSQQIPFEIARNDDAMLAFVRIGFESFRYAVFRLSIGDSSFATQLNAYSWTAAIAAAIMKPCIFNYQPSFKTNNSKQSKEITVPRCTHWLRFRSAYLIRSPHSATNPKAKKIYTCPHIRTVGLWMQFITFNGQSFAVAVCHEWYMHMQCIPCT